MEQKNLDKILIIDDEVTILELCQRVLKSEGYSVTAFSEAKKILPLIAEENFDVILSDLKMPEMDGIELLKKVKERSPQTQVIIMTGQATAETAVESLRNGAYDYIFKPFNIKELVTSVRKCIDYGRLMRQENIYRETTNLYRMAQEVSKTKSEKKLFALIMQLIVKTLKADSGSIYMFVQKKEILELVSYDGIQEPMTSHIKMGERIAGWVAENQKPLLIQDGFRNLPQFANMEVRSDLVSSMVSPLINNDVLLGVICLDRFADKTNYQFTPHDMESLQIFVTHACLLISALRHQQAIEELNHLKMEFMANVSHELRTPLMAISGAAELLESYAQDSSDGGKIKMFIDLISRNSGRMKYLVNDLLDFSRIEKGVLKIELTKFDMSALIKDIVEDFSINAKEKTISLSSECGEVDIQIVADKERIKQILANLVNNAMKFTREGGWIKIECALKNEENVLISVSDSGIGIEKSKQGKIFEKFYQVDGSVSRSQGGFGLGLSITKSIVEAHKGKIWVESEFGKGSKFNVLLPLVLDAKNSETGG